MKSFSPSRRIFVLAAAVSATAGCVSPNQLSEGNEPDIFELMADELDRNSSLGAQMSPDALKKLRDNPKWATSAASQSKAEWAPPLRNIDYNHLTTFGPPPQEFVLTAEVLSWLAERNHFEINQQEPVTIFGLRGCTLSSSSIDSTDWEKAHKVSTTTPDHLSLRCLIGVWRRATGELRLFKASTVPHADYVWASRNLVGAGAPGECNLQPTGLYELVTGSQAGRSFPQHGILRQPADQPIVVLRSPDNLIFDSTSPNETWQKGYFGNNLHSACRMSNNWFSSAGCQVVAGSYYREPPEQKDRRGLRPRGAWADFRISIGLRDEPQVEGPSNPDRNRRFQYMLLTGSEAAFYANSNQVFLKTYRRIRFGSKTPTDGAVGSLQKRLPNVSVTGRFGADTAYEYIRSLQQANAFEAAVIAI